MAKYLVAEWENNHYDDSDFYIAYYDSDTNKVYSHEIGSTRYAGGNHYPEDLEDLTSEVAVKVHDWLESRWVHILTVRAKMDNEKPDSVSKGDSMKVITAHTNRKETMLCQSCHGSGIWTNPKQVSDTRHCFRCYGNGYRTGGNKIIKIEVGAVVEVVNSYVKLYSTYRKYRDAPGRFDYECLVKMCDSDDSDKYVRIPLEKLTRNESIDYDSITETAKLRANHAEFGAMFILNNVAWLTNNYLAKFYN